MATLEAVCRTRSTLSPVQIHILQNSEELLQFASDLSHRELFVYVPGREAGTLVLAAHRTPLLQKGRQTETTDPGAAFSRYEEPLNYQVFQAGTAMRGEKEIEYGRMAPIVAYPFVDNGGGTIAVISFVGTVEDNREILTETAFLSLQVPMDFHSMYRPLSIRMASSWSTATASSSMPTIWPTASCTCAASAGPLRGPISIIPAST